MTYISRVLTLQQHAPFGYCLANDSLSAHTSWRPALYTVVPDRLSFLLEQHSLQLLGRDFYSTLALLCSGLCILQSTLVPGRELFCLTYTVNVKNPKRP